VSDKVTAKSKAAGALGFAEFETMMRERIADGTLRGHSPAFVSSIIASLAETTMDFMMREPAHADRVSASGFEALWGAIASNPK